MAVVRRRSRLLALMVLLALACAAMLAASTAHARPVAVDDDDDDDEFEGAPPPPPITTKKKKKAASPRQTRTAPPAAAAAAAPAAGDGASHDNGKHAPKRRKKGKSRHHAASGAKTAGGGSKKVAGVAVTFKLQHSFTGTEQSYKPRGTMQVRTQQHTGATSVVFKGAPELSASELADFKASAASGGRYFIRTRVIPSDPTSPYVIASTRACMLLATNLREELLLHVDASGLLTSMEFVFPDGTSCDAAAPSKLKSVFRSKASVQAPQTVSIVPEKAVGGAPFPGQSLNPTAPSSDGTGAAPATDAPQKAGSSWTRYLIYIIPVVALMMFSGGGDPKAAGGNGRGGGGGASGGRARS